MLDQLLQKVKNAIWNDDSNMYQPNGNRGNLINTIEDLFANHQSQYMQNQPTGMDPYGNHTDESRGRFGNVLPSSRDPYGDPADQGNRQFGNVQPASRDPYGDPADEERR